MSEENCLIQTILENHLSEIIIAIMGIVSSVISYNLSKSQKILEMNISRKERIYTGTIESLELLRTDYQLIFSSEYIKSLCNTKAKVRLFADEEVITKYKLVWIDIMSRHKKYLSYVDERLHENGLDAELVEEITENGETDYQGYQPSFDDYKRFAEEVREYEMSARESELEINPKIDDLIESMRKSLKVK